MSWKELFTAAGCLEGANGNHPELDVEPPEALILGISKALVIPEYQLRAGSLDQVLSRVLTPQELRSNLGHNWRGRHITWVLPNAWQSGRAVIGDSRGGIPYCPLCFAESRDPHFLIQHRISLNLSCEQHGVWLKDDCPRCGSRVGPMSLVSGGDWSLGSDTPLCAQCHSNESDSREQRPSPLQLERASNRELAFHALLRTAFEGGSVSLPGVGNLPAVQFLSGLRYVNTAASHYTDQGIGVPINDVIKRAPESGVIPRSRGQRSLELLPLLTRRSRLSWFQWVCEGPLDRWHALRNNLPPNVALKKSWSHPWDGVGPDGEFEDGNTWQSGRKVRTDKANLNQVKTFFDLTKQIGLSDRTICGLLGEISSKECQVWSNRPSRRVPTECRHRMAHFLRIWAGLVKVYRDEAAASRWLQEPSGLQKLNGKTPLQFLARDQTGRGFEFVSRLIGSQDP